MYTIPGTLVADACAELAVNFTGEGALLIAFVSEAELLHETEMVQDTRKHNV